MKLSSGIRQTLSFPCQEQGHLLSRCIQVVVVKWYVHVAIKT